MSGHGNPKICSKQAPTLQTGSKSCVLLFEQNTPNEKGKQTKQIKKQNHTLTDQSTKQNSSIKHK
jgi:hypothetical protein